MKPTLCRCTYIRTQGFRAFFFGVTFFLGAQAFALTLSQVQITGNKRIEEQAVRDKVTLKAGRNYSLKVVTEDVKRLFATGFFYNIKVDLTGSVLTYQVEEKPLIYEVEYLGNRAFDDDELSEAAKVKSNELLDIKKVNATILELKKKYEEEGYYLAQIDYKTEVQKKGASQKLIFKISEGDKVKIRKVNLIGNRAVSDQKLKAFMATKETGFWGMGGAFQKDTLARDKEAIAFVYQNEGYAQVQVSPAQVALTRNKKGLIVNYHINEGKKYKLGEVSFSGDVDFKEEELLKLVKIDESAYFSRLVLTQDISELQAKYGGEGYAYTNVVPRPRMLPEEEVVHIDFNIDKGEKITIGEINVIGNTNTRDKVVRREFRLYEGELYNETNKRKSLANVRRLGFFKNVDLQTKVGAQDNIMDMDVSIEERSTGQLQVGAGYGGFQGFSLQGSLQQANFLGKGVNFGGQINYAERGQQSFMLSLTDPYFRDTDWSLGFRAYRNLGIMVDYSSIRTGGGLTLGRRINDYFMTSLGYTFEKVEVDIADSAMHDVFTPQRKDESEGYSSGLTLSFVYDKRNDRMLPTDGYYARASFEQTGIGGNLNFSKLSTQFSFYQPVIGSLVWRNNFNYGWVGSSSGEVPLQELFRLGGPRSVRGYDFFSIAQRRNSINAYQSAVSSGYAADAHILSAIPYGGVQQFYYNLEFEWSLIKEAGFRGVVFFDVGTAQDEFSMDEFKSAWGLGVRWNSPMGPLRFEWAFAIDPDKRRREKSEDFQFSIMQTF